MRFPALGEHVGHDDDRDGCICGCPDEAHETVGDDEEGVSCAAHPGSWCIWAPISVGAVIREMRAELDRLRRDVEAKATGMRVLCEEREAALVRADQNEAAAEDASKYVAELQAQLATYDEAVKIEHACAVKALDREYAFKDATARELSMLRELLAVATSWRAEIGALDPPVVGDWHRPLIRAIAAAGFSRKPVRSGS